MRQEAGQHLIVPHPVAMKESNESLRRHFQERNALCIFLSPLSEDEVIKQRLETMISRFMRYTACKKSYAGH